MKLDWEITIRRYTDRNRLSVFEGEKILEISCGGRTQKYTERFHPLEEAVRDFVIHLARRGV